MFMKLKLLLVLFFFLMLGLPAKASKKFISSQDKKTQKIESLYSSKKYEVVVDLLAGQWSSASAKSLSYLANSFSALEQYSQQIKVLEFLKAKKPNQYIWYFKLGVAYENLHKQSSQKKYKDSATKNYRKAMEINPKFKPPYTKLLAMFARDRNLYEGRTMASVILTQFGASPEVSQNLCKLYSLDGYIQEAITNCSVAIQDSPALGDNHMYLANAFLDKKDKLTATKIFSKAAKNFPKSEFVQVTTGDFNFSEKLYRAACKNYKAALKVNEKSEQAHVGRAQCLFQLGKPGVALSHYIQACKINSKFIKEFKVATSRLLTTGQNKFYSRYENSLYKCHN